MRYSVENIERDYHGGGHVLLNQRMEFLCCVVCICIYSISSPYLLVFGDDHVRGTWEQMMLQVDLMRLVDRGFSKQFGIDF